MKSVLARLIDEGVQTRGHWTFFKDDVKVFDCLTLELGWHQNSSQKSCIPAGRYNLTRYKSDKFGECLYVENVPARSGILVHVGNYNMDTHGCILVGKTFSDINADGYKDVVSSRNTMKKIMSIVPDEFELLIVNV